MRASASKTAEVASVRLVYACDTPAQRDTNAGRKLTAPASPLSEFSKNFILDHFAHIVLDSGLHLTLNLHAYTPCKCAYATAGACGAKHGGHMQADASAPPALQATERCRCRAEKL